MARKKVSEVEEEKEVEVKEEVEYPEVGNTGKFHAVAVGDGFVLYNPAGQRASGIMDEVKAKDLARQNNTAAHIK